MEVTLNGMCDFSSGAFFHFSFSNFEFSCENVFFQNRTRESLFALFSFSHSLDNSLYNYVLL